jgi:hypothetical protein
MTFVVDKQIVLAAAVIAAYERMATGVESAT